MIIFLLLASAVVFVTFFIMKKSFWHHVAYGIGLVILVASVLLIVLNVRDHYGMKKVSTHSTETLVSDSPNEKLPMLLYKGLGDGTEKVFVYKTANEPEDRKKTSIKQERVSIHVQTDADKTKATLTKKITRWEYQSDFFRLLFGIAGNDKTVESLDYTFNVPKNWLVISTDQANKIKEYSEKNQAVMAAKAKEEVQAMLLSYLQQHPTASPEEKQAKMLEITTLVQAKTVEQMLTDLKIHSYQTSK